MVTFCFFISVAYSYCYTTENVKPVPIVSRSEVVQRSTEMITRYEWLALEAYPDTRGWSIGYGTRSHQGETITQQEAWARMEAIVAQSVRRVMRDFPEASENEIVALTSLFYNCHGWYKRLKREWYEAWLDPKFCTLPGYSWLIDRRNEERRLIWFDSE